MSSPVLRLQAEQFPPTGGMAGDGVRKLLGTPRTTLLQTMVREAVQNSWDARLDDSGIDFRIRLRTLSADERLALAGRIMTELPLSEESAAPMRLFLGGDAQVVLELSDWNTRGLGGPTRADVVPRKDEASDFVNFIRNIGVPRDTDQGGGTYGYGKSSLYSASACSTIIVDTLAHQPAAMPIRRLIGCHVGRRFDCEAVGRLTGRYWWGVASPDGLMEPAVGDDAAGLATAFGLPGRGVDRTGTTITVLAPRLTGDLRMTAAEIQEAILWYFWPKMIADTDGGRPIRFSLEVEGQAIPMPEPQDFPPLDLFVEAYRALKAGEGVKPIECLNPRKLLGRYVIRRGFRSDRRPVAPPDVSTIPETSAHIAVMRPVELVVRYIEGAALPSADHEWAGVFICDTDAEVEQAFADSEPPAHDDWVPEQLSDSRAKRFVRVALHRLGEAANSYASPGGATATGGAVQPALARAADALGACIPDAVLPGGSGGGGGGSGGSGGSGGRGGRGGNGRGSARPSVDGPRFVTLAEGAAGIVALFEMDITNPGADAVFVQADPLPVIDGELAPNRDDDDPDIPFVSWESAEGTVLSTDRRLRVDPGFAGAVIARVGVPQDTAVGLRARLLQGAPA